MLAIRNVVKKYGDFTALNGVSCDIAPGAVCGLVGFNGAGKTTLLKTACGVYKPDSGGVTLNGQPVYDSESAKGSIFFVSDSPYVLPQASMKRMAAFYKRYYTSWNEGLYDKLVALFKLDPNKRLAGFSKGMRKQAFIVFALSLSTDFLLLDEVFDGLDPVMREMARKLLLSSVGSRGTGVLISSHNMLELEGFCSRVCVLSENKIVYDGSAEGMRAFIAEMDNKSYDFSGLFTQKAGGK